jgi:hypothetical protein
MGDEIGPVERKAALLEPVCLLLIRAMGPVEVEVPDAVMFVLT